MSTNICVQKFIIHRFNAVNMNPSAVWDINPEQAYSQWLHLPAHLVLLTSGGPGGPVPPSPGRVRRTLMRYSVSGSRCQTLYVSELTPCVSDHGEWLALYTISLRITGPSPTIELVLSWMIRYVGPERSSWGGAIGVGGTTKE